MRSLVLLALVSLAWAGGPAGSKGSLAWIGSPAPVSEPGEEELLTVTACDSRIKKLGLRLWEEIKKLRF